MELSQEEIDAAAAAEQQQSEQDDQDARDAADAEAQRQADQDAQDAEDQRVAEAAQQQAEQDARDAADAEAQRQADQDAQDAEDARLAEAAEAERIAEAERLEAERLEAERLEAERIAEAERLEAERLEAERLEAERLEAEGLSEAERLEAERLATARRDAERIAAAEAEAVALEERKRRSALLIAAAEAARLAAEAEAERLRQVELARRTPSVSTYNRFLDNPAGSQYVLLKGPDGVDRWYIDRGLFGIEVIPGMPPPGATTSEPVNQQSGTVSTTGNVAVNPSGMGPLQIPLVTQLKNPDASNYGTLVLAYDVNGRPHWYRSTQLFGWVDSGTPVPAGTPTGIIHSYPAPPSDPVTPTTNCGGFHVNGNGIPAGLVYGSAPGEYVAYSGSAQVSNYSQFGEIETATWGNAPYDYYDIGSVDLISSNVNQQGFTVCVFNVNFSRASRNADTPDPVPDQPDPPTAGVLSITVAENSVNNAVTLPVTGSSATGISYLTVNRAGSTVVSAGTSNILQHQYTPAPNYSGADRIAFRVRGRGGDSELGHVYITITPGASQVLLLPIAGFSTLTVAENSVNNVVGLSVIEDPPTAAPVTGIDYLNVNQAGSTVVSAGAANILQQLYTPAPNWSSGDRIIFRVRGANGVSGFGRVEVTITPGAPICTPLPFNFLDLGYQEGNVVLEGTSVTIIGSPSCAFPGEWNMALFADYISLDPGGAIPPRYQDGLYVVGIKRTRGGTPTTFNISSTPVGTPNSLRVGVQNGDIITPIIRTPCANAGAQTVVDYRMRLSPPGYPDGPGGGYSVLEDTFQVRVQIADVQPDPFAFQDQAGLNVSSSVDTNAVTIQGVTACTPVPVRLNLVLGSVLLPHGNLLIDNGSGYVTAGDTSVVYLGDTVKARITTPAIHSSTDIYRVTMGIAGSQQTDDFSMTTRAPLVGPDPPWYTDQTGLNVSQTSDTESVVFNIEVTGTLSVNNGATLVINGVHTGLSSTAISAGQSVQIRATSSSSYSTSRTFTVTLVVVSSTYVDTFIYTTRAQIANPTYSGNFVNQTGRELSEVVTSNTLTVSAFDGPQTLTLTNDNSDSTAVIFKNGANAGSTTTISAGDTVAIRGTADVNDYYKTTTYTLTCGTTTRNWSITTKHNDHMLLFDPY